MITSPPEIVLQILQAVSPSQKVALLAVCSTFYNEPIPHIYRTLPLNLSTVRGVIQGVDNPASEVVSKSKSLKYAKTVLYLDLDSIRCTSVSTNNRPPSGLLFENCTHLHIGQSLIYRLCERRFNPVFEGIDIFQLGETEEDQGKSSNSGVLTRQVSPRSLCIDIHTPWHRSLKDAGQAIDRLTNKMFQDNKADRVGMIIDLMDGERLILDTKLIGRTEECRFLIDIDDYTPPSLTCDKLWTHYSELKELYPDTKITYEIGYDHDLSSAMSSRLHQEPHESKLAYEGFIKAVRIIEGSAERRCDCHKLIERYER